MVAILFSKNLKGKIQNIVNDNAGRIITVTFTLNKPNSHITTLYGPNIQVPILTWSQNLETKQLVQFPIHTY